MLRVNDFFCGAGGMGLGFKEAGFEIAGAWDFDAEAVATYAENVGDHVGLLDITKMKWSDVPAADVWTYGFPCQDLSKAGNMAGIHEGKRSRLFFEVMRLLDETAENNPSNMPPVIMAENVEQLRKYIPVLEEEYQKRGYKCYYRLFTSKYWGVPQNRKRYFVVGVRDDIDAEFEFPEESEQIATTLADILEPETEVDPALYVDYETKFPELIYSCPGDFLIVKQATKRGFDYAFPGDAINVAFPTSKTRRGRVGRQVAQTILTGREQCVVLDDLRIRYLTTRETARLQGFPDSYRFGKGAQKQLGNAVTVNVARALADQIKSFLHEHAAILET